MKKVMLGLLVAGLCAATTITPYTDEGEWNTAVGAAGAFYQYTETFDDAVFEPWLTITSDQPGGIVNWQWRSIVDSNPVKMDTFYFSAPAVIAWCGTLNLAVPGGPGEGIDILANLVLGSGYQSAYVLPGTFSGFLGFVVEGDTFTAVQFRGAGGAGGQETYWLDDMSIAGVPEAGTYALVGAGLLLVGMLRRRRK